MEGTKQINFRIV